jgi:hypothetical protein
MRYVHALVGLSVGVCAATAGATPLNLVLQDTPDIFSAFIQTNYDAETSLFTARGTALTIDFPPVLRGEQVPITNGFFSIDATINNEGEASGGNLVILGTIDPDRSAPALLEGSLIAFGFPDSTGRGNGGELGPLEFIFNITGGLLADDFGLGRGSAQVGVILAGNGYPGSWNGGWRNDGNGVADTAPLVPAPFTAIGTLAAAGFIVTRRRR